MQVTLKALIYSRRMLLAGFSLQGGKMLGSLPLSRTVSLRIAMAATACSDRRSNAPAIPIEGTWDFPVPGTSCIESYTFRSDGTRTFKSNDEQETAR